MYTSCLSSLTWLNIQCVNTHAIHYNSLSIDDQTTSNAASQNLHLVEKFLQKFIITIALMPIKFHTRLLSTFKIEIEIEIEIYLTIKQTNKHTNDEIQSL